MYYLLCKSSWRIASSIKPTAVQRNCCILKFIREILTPATSKYLNYPSQWDTISPLALTSISRLCLKNSSNKDFIAFKSKSLHIWANLAIRSLFCINGQKFHHSKYYNMWSCLEKSTEFLSLWQLLNNLKTITLTLPYSFLLLLLCVTHAHPYTPTNMHTHVVFSLKNIISLPNPLTSIS